MASLFHHSADLYPGMGYLNTSLVTVPEPEDQVALPDDQKIATDMKASHSPVTSGNIWRSIGIVMVIVILLGYFGRG